MRLLPTRSAQPQLRKTSLDLPVKCRREVAQRLFGKATRPDVPPRHHYRDAQWNFRVNHAKRKLIPFTLDPIFSSFARRWDFFLRITQLSAPLIHALLRKGASQVVGMTTAAEITLGVNRDRRQLLQPPSTRPRRATPTKLQTCSARFFAGRPSEAKPLPGKRAVSFSGVLFLQKSCRGCLTNRNSCTALATFLVTKSEQRHY
jgi:hypothetical protein